jgi:hypothetical protein
MKKLLLLAGVFLALVTRRLHGADHRYKEN